MRRDQHRLRHIARNLLRHSAPASTIAGSMAAATRAHAAMLRDAGTTAFRPVAQAEQPPFDFRADLLLVAALVPTAPLRATFPDIALLSAGGRAPLVAWFSRVCESCYRAAGNIHCTRAEGEGAYAELTLLLPLRDGRCFVPHIAASSALSQRLAHAYYGMPKALVPATFGDHGGRLRARIAQSSLAGRRVGGRTPLTAVARATLPRWGSWQACFPSGGRVRVRLPWVDGVELVRLGKARLAPHPPWLPDPARPLGLGVLLAGARMRLLPPQEVPWPSVPAADSLRDGGNNEPSGGQQSGAPSGQGGQCQPAGRS